MPRSGSPLTRGSCLRQNRRTDRKMKPTWLCLLIAASPGCRDASAPWDGSAPIQTDAAAYGLEAGSAGYAATIHFVFTNPRPTPVYVVNCSGNAPPALETFIDGTWRKAWSPIVPLCLSPPIVIAAGQAYQGTLQLFAGFPTNNVYPKFDTPQISGQYRLVWSGLLSSYDADAHPFGEPLPLAQRISNSFRLAAP